MNQVQLQHSAQQMFNIGCWFLKRRRKEECSLSNLHTSSDINQPLCYHLSSVSSAVSSGLVPEDSYLLYILHWCFLCHNFLFLLCHSFEIYRFSVCFHFTSILELCRDICFLRDAFKCFSIW